MNYTHSKLGTINARDAFRLDGKGYSAGYLQRHPGEAEKLGFTEVVPEPIPEPEPVERGPSLEEQIEDLRARVEQLEGLKNG